MCMAMVIIHTKSLEKKGVDDVTSKESTLDLVRLERPNRSVVNYRLFNDTSSLSSGNSSSCHDFTGTSRCNYTGFSLMEFTFLGKTTGVLYCVGKKACFCNICNECNPYRSCTRPHLATGGFGYADHVPRYSLGFQAHRGNLSDEISRKWIQIDKQGSFRWLEVLKKTKNNQQMCVILDVRVLQSLKFWTKIPYVTKS